MLVISRREGESIRIGGEITVRVLEIKGESVRIGIDAPASVRIARLSSPAPAKAAGDKTLDFADPKSDTSTH
jgi:carbon storage regulator